MKRLKEVVFLTVTALCAPLMVYGAEPANAPTLRYQFAPDITNAYRLQIESQGEAGREAIEGVYVVSAKSVTGNVATLIFKGQLRQKAVPNNPMVSPYRGPGYPVSLSSYAMRPSIETMEIVVDNEGNVLRDSGDTPLPIPLGELMRSLFEKFPTAAMNTWDSEREVSVVDEPMSMGPVQGYVNSQYGGMNFGYSPGRSGLGILATISKTKVRVTDVAGDILTLHKTMALDSRMLTASEPRTSASGEAEILFDQKAGMPRSIEFQCKAAVVTENVSRRTATTLTWKLLEGAEREAALNPPPPQPNPAETEMAATNLVALTQKLKADETYEKENAVRQLATAKISDPSPELMAQMIELIDDPNNSVDNSALTFVANHATEGQAMLLIRNLNTKDQTTRTVVIKALGRLKDKRAAEPLADALAMGQMDQLQNNYGRSGDAADALVRIGAAAEPAVLGLLKERNNATRWQACGILKRIGTAKSLPALKELSLAPSKELSEAASEAYRSIEARQK